MHRRDFLGGALTGALSTACSSNQAEALHGAKTEAALDPTTMAAELLRTDRGELPALAMQWIARGADSRELLAAALLAGVQEVASKPIGGQVHAMMMVPSAAMAARRLRGRTALLPALFDLDRVKNSQARDARSDWRLPPAPPLDERPFAAVAADFAGAIAKWDEAACDRLATALHGCAAPDEFFELLWPAAIRDFRVIGHKAIYAAQAHLALQDLGWRHALPVIRSVLFGVLDLNPYGSATPAESQAILDLYPANQARASELPADWPTGRPDPQLSHELCDAMRDATPAAAAAALVAAARTGASADTLWDALRLRAFELLLVMPSVPCVHAVTSVNALRTIAGATRQPSIQRTALLQAASWLPLFRPFLSRPSDPVRPDLRIRGVEPGESGDPVDDSDEARRRGRAARLLADGNGAEFARRSFEVLARKAHGEHDYKFAAAAVAEIEAATPALRPCLAGAATSYLRHLGDADATVYGEVADWLKG